MKCQWNLRCFASATGPHQSSECPRLHEPADITVQEFSGTTWDRDGVSQLLPREGFLLRKVGTRGRVISRRVNIRRPEAYIDCSLVAVSEEPTCFSRFSFKSFLFWRRAAFNFLVSLFSRAKMLTDRIELCCYARIGLSMEQGTNVDHLQERIPEQWLA
jgi:hypothetical protein